MPVRRRHAVPAPMRSRLKPLVLLCWHGLLRPLPPLRLSPPKKSALLPFLTLTVKGRATAPAPPKARISTPPPAKPAALAGSPSVAKPSPTRLPPLGRLRPAMAMAKPCRVTTCSAQDCGTASTTGCGMPSRLIYWIGGSSTAKRLRMLSHMPLRASFIRRMLSSKVPRSRLKAREPVRMVRR